jgi:hypothetical protein
MGDDEDAQVGGDAGGDLGSCRRRRRRLAAWSQGLRRATLDGPLRTGVEARIVLRTGLRLRFRFRVVECEEGRLFTDVATLPGARIGHQHLLEPTAVGSRLTNTIYIDGPLAAIWRRVLGPRLVVAGQSPRFAQ